MNHRKQTSPSLLSLLSLTLCVATHAVIHPPPAKHFHAFGPLPAVSSPGSNPLHVVAPYSHIALANLLTFPSEAARGGQALWRPCTYNQSDTSVTCPFEEADPTETYTFWASANISFSPAEAHTAILNTTDPLELVPSTGDSVRRMQSCHADVYEDKRSLCVLRFEAEHYRLLVEVVGQGNHSSFQLNYEKPPSYVQSNPLVALNHTALPDVLIRSKPFSASLAGNQMSVALLNAHHSHYAEHGVATLVSPPPGLLLPNPALVDLAPRQSRSLRIDLSINSKFQPRSEEESDELSLMLNIAYTINGARTHIDVPFSLRLLKWRVDHAYVFTYVDTDGSVQACAVVPPAGPCTHSNGCVPLLSTHGAGVDATALAWTDSYRAQNGSWVILPTGRRRYGMNWEGAQMQSAITALETFVRDMPGVPQDERSSYALRRGAWLQAGHSMGGHGALLIASHYPDSIVAALPAMAWMRLERFGGSEGLGEDSSFSNAGVHALLAVGREQYASDLYHENLLGIPFLARIGSEDDNVPPSELRQYCRLLRENEMFHNITKSKVRLDEVPGEGHWFDGVVDDDALQPFLTKHLAVKHKPRLPEVFSVATMNPGTSGSRGGLLIRQLLTPIQTGRLRVVRDANQWYIEPENVRRFSYGFVDMIRERAERIIIAGKSFEVSDQHLELCLHSSSVWKTCNGRAKGERKERDYGPLGHVLLGEVVIVYPRGNEWLLREAVFYANGLYSHGINAQVVSDTIAILEGVLRSSAGVVMFGGPNVNRAAREFERRRPKRVGVWSEERDGSICAEVGGLTKCYSGDGTGGAYLAAGLGGGLVAIASGGSRDALLAAIDLLPRSPTSKVAEWAVVSIERGWGYRGLGGMRAAGYLDWSWRVSDRAATFFDEGFVDGDGGLCLVRRERGGWRSIVVYGLVLLVGVVLGVFWKGRRLEGGVRDKGAPKGAPRVGRDEEERETLVSAEGGLADRDADAEASLGA